MNPTKLAAVALVLATAAATLIAGPARADTIAQENPPVLIAQDTTPDPATIPATVVGIDANVVGGLSVAGHGGKRVTATAKGQRTRSVTAPANRPAVLRNLTPGVRYTVAIAGRRIGTAVPLAQVGAASGLKVETTSIPGTVVITWSHAANKGEGSAIAFDVTATPLNADGTDGLNVVSVTATETSATLESLVTTTRYRFTVTPRNTASTGRATSATMSKNLNEITGAAISPATPVPPPVVPVTPTAASAPAPAPAPAAGPAPSKTIYVCPDGYTETPTGACQKTMAYTFHRVTETTPYTYHQESQASTVSVPATFNGSVWTWSCPSGYDAGGGQWGVGICKGTVQATVKDYPPTGWYDTGTCFAHDIDVKDVTPSGYTDDGTQWVTVTSKVAKIVSA